MTVQPKHSFCFLKHIASNFRLLVDSGEKNRSISLNAFNQFSKASLWLNFQRFVWYPLKLTLAVLNSYEGLREKHLSQFLLGMWQWSLRPLIVSFRTDCDLMQVTFFAKYKYRYPNLVTFWLISTESELSVLALGSRYGTCTFKESPLQRTAFVPKKRTP